jgi:integrase
VGKIRKSLSLT